MTLRAVLLLGLASLAACGQEATTPPVGQIPRLGADQVLYGVSHNITREGVRQARVAGDSAYVMDEGARLELMGVDLAFYNELGKEGGTLTSRTGEYRPASNAFIARGNVVLITQGEQGPRRLETEELHYDPKSNQIWSEKPFVLKEGNRIARGQSFRSDATFQNLTVERAQTQGGLPGGDRITF